MNLLWRISCILPNLILIVHDFSICSTRKQLECVLSFVNSFHVRCLVKHSSSFFIVITSVFSIGLYIFAYNQTDNVIIVFFRVNDMKRIISSITGIAVLILFFSSCSSPNGVAEKALKLVGRGTFVPTSVDKYLGGEPMSTIGLFTDYGDIFDNALIDNSEAEFFLENGYTRETPRRVYFNFSDVMFSKFELINKKEISYDIRSIIDYSKFDGLTPEAIQRLKDAYNNLHKEYKEQGTIATWLEGEGVLTYILRYNLENKNIAEITVLKLPDKGYRVCSFRVE